MMTQEKSTYQKFEDFKTQVAVTLLVIAGIAYALVAMKTCFIDPQTVRQVYSQGVNDAINNQ